MLTDYQLKNWVETHYFHHIEAYEWAKDARRNLLKTVSYEDGGYIDREMLDNVANVIEALERAAFLYSIAVPTNNEKADEMKKFEMIEGQLIYIAHPYGGDKENVKRVEECLERLQNKYPCKTLFSPLHNWDWDTYDPDHQTKPMQDCLTILKRCDAVILCGNWKKSMGCMQEYSAAYVLGIPVFELNEEGIKEIG